MRKDGLADRLPTHLKVTVANWTSRAIGASVQLATIPLLTHSLGTESFAAYTIAVSLMGWFALSDLGTGSSLQNFVSEARAKGQRAAAEIGIVVLVCLSTTVLGVVGLAYASPRIAQFLFSSMPAVSDRTGTQLVFVAGTLFLCHSTGTVATRLLYALGRGVAANILAAVSSLVSFGLLWGATRFWQGEGLLLPAFLCYALPASLLGLGTALVLFTRYGTWDPAALTSRYGPVFKRSRGFFLIGVLSIAVLNIDYLIMSQTLTPSHIATYNVLSRIFGLLITLYSGLLSATWVHWSETIALGRWEDVRRLSRKYVRYGLLTVGLLTLVITLMPYRLFGLLLPPDSALVLPSTIVLFGVYTALRVWTDTATVALQAANQTAVFIQLIPLQAAIAVAGQLTLVGPMALDGILLGLIVSFASTVAWVLPWRVARLAVGQRAS